MCFCSCSEGSVHHTVAEVVRFVEERIKGEEGKESRSLRGPFLARLELIHRLRERGCTEESTLGESFAQTAAERNLPSRQTGSDVPPLPSPGEPLELMVQFFAKFGDKPCCITDLKLYLHLLSPDQHVQVRRRLRSHLFSSVSPKAEKCVTGFSSWGLSSLIG